MISCLIHWHCYYEPVCLYSAVSCILFEKLNFTLFLLIIRQPCSVCSEVEISVFCLSCKTHCYSWYRCIIRSPWFICETLEISWNDIAVIKAIFLFSSGLAAGCYRQLLAELGQNQVDIKGVQQDGAGRPLVTLQVLHYLVDGRKK